MTGERQFLDELEKYSLLSPGQLQECRNLGEDLGSEARQVAGELICRGWLTPYQANQVLQGRGQSLLLGPYVLLERLGQGGMGQVFKARHVLMDRIVALKIIHADRLDQPEALGRFRREMQAAAKLAHPNVVLAHDAALLGEVYYLVMEYVEGNDLARLLKQHTRLAPGQACAYVRQAALGLQHAHERGLVHRDIKPSNLILASRGMVKILDLGLARLRTSMDKGAASADLTREGSVMGTPDYIAPEQALDSRTADIRADIYSLGCTLYHFLTGQPPFPGGSLTEKLLKHQQAEPERVEILCPDVPPGLGAVVRKMMAKQPKDRYRDPQEAADALAPFAFAGNENAALMPETSPAPEPDTIGWSPESTSVLGSGKRPSFRRWFRNRIALGVAGVLVVLIGGFLFLLKEWSPPLEKRAEMPAPPEKKPAINPNGSGPVEIPRLPQLLADAPARLVKDLQGHTGKILALAFSTDSKRLASGADDNVVRIWDAGNGEFQKPALRHGDPVRALAWSPDGKRLASGGWGGGYEARIKLWDQAKPGDEKALDWKDRTGTPTQADLRGLAFSPNGKHLASGGGPLRIWNLDQDSAPLVLTWQKTLPSYIYGVAFSPDGKTVAAGCHEMGDTVRVWELAKSGEPMVLRGNDKAFGLSHSDVRGTLAFVAGGKLLIRVTSAGLQEKSGSVMVWDVDPGQERIIWRESFKIPGGAVFALISAADGNLRVAVAQGAPRFGAGTEPVSGEVKLWDRATSEVWSFETGHKGNITSLAFSPDGTRLATGSADQSVKLWILGK